MIFHIWKQKKKQWQSVSASGTKAELFGQADGFPAGPRCKK